MEDEKNSRDQASNAIPNSLNNQNQLRIKVKKSNPTLPLKKTFHRPLVLVPHWHIKILSTWHSLQNFCPKTSSKIFLTSVIVHL